MNEQSVEILIEKYVSGTIGPEEKEQFFTIIARSTPAELDALMKKVWEESSTGPGATVSSASLKRINTIMAHIKDAPVKRFQITRWQWIAAASVIFMVITMSYFYIARTSVFRNANTTYSATTIPGQKKKLTLPDRSIVYLNGGSTLSYTDEFGAALREVTLSGEAYFEVAKNAAKPFIIHAGELDVRVVGTSFNVSSYGKQESFKVTVSSGTVKVGFNGHTGIRYFTEQTLTAGQQLIFSPQKQLVVNSGNDIKIDLSWKEGVLIFKNKPLPEVTAMLERWYNVHIQIDIPNPDKYRLTGTFESLSLTEVLDVLKLTGDFSYKQADGRIIIYGKNNP